MKPPVWSSYLSAQVWLWPILPQQTVSPLNSDLQFIPENWIQVRWLTDKLQLLSCLCPSCTFPMCSILTHNLIYGERYGFDFLCGLLTSMSVAPLKIHLLTKMSHSVVDFRYQRNIFEVEYVSTSTLPYHWTHIVPFHVAAVVFLMQLVQLQ